jgi:2-polyprenyl-6-methoxyphenol hydroxylase-like FAD-dependent oxidoreductase
LVVGAGPTGLALASQLQTFGARFRIIDKEQQCCAFLHFELSEIDEGVRLTITAPERAREVAAALFEQFVPAGVRHDHERGTVRP